MAKRRKTTSWAGLFARNARSLSGIALQVGQRAAKVALRRAVRPRSRSPVPGDWLSGMALGAGGARRYHLYRPVGAARGERLPLLVMLHGCGQDAESFADSTRMNTLANKERFLVLYPEQDRLANPHGCWNWFESGAGRAQAEVTLVFAAIDQAVRLYGADAGRVALVGMSAGASLAALAAIRHPDRIRAVVMHSGVPPWAAHSGATAVAAMRGRRAGTAPPAPTAGSAAWPPLLVLHGAEDRVVVPANGRAAALAWAQAGGALPGEARALQRGQRYARRVIDYRRGPATVVEFAEIERLGHAWSGGSSHQPFGDPAGPDASRMAWAFAARQFRRHVATGPVVGS